MAEFKVALKAIIHKDGKIWVLKRSCEEDVFAELWDIPGGKIEYGEKTTDGIKREVFEETGLDVEIEFRPWSLWSFMTPVKERQTVGLHPFSVSRSSVHSVPLLCQGTTGTGL